MRALAGRPVAPACIVAAIWLLAIAAQSHLPLSSAWALLDGVRHAAAGAFLAVWLKPRWGWFPVIAAGAAALLLDLDHAVAAGSLDPQRMLSLGVRPPTHSLVFAAAVAAIVWVSLGRASGVAVGMALSAHLFEDALGAPGVPLLFPFVTDAHIVVPAVTAAVSILAIVLVGLTLAHQPCHAAGSSLTRRGGTTTRDCGGDG